MKRTDKFFVLDLNGKQDTVAIDRLKVVYLNDDLTPVSNQQTMDNAPAETVIPVSPPPTPVICPTQQRATRSG